MEVGIIASVMLFCASLPRVYAMPSIAAVLNCTGHLERATAGRIRTTASLILAVILEGGLTAPTGHGISRLLLTRVVHAAARHAALPPCASRLPSPCDSTVARQGKLWNLERYGMPCNQADLAYTLLSFSHVVSHSLRQLGLGLSTEDEEAYLHTWNVAGHILGVRLELMAQTSVEAEALRELLETRSPALDGRMDPRPGLGWALLSAIESSIPWTALVPVGSLMTEYLCGADVARRLQLQQRGGWALRCLFYAFMFLLRQADRALGRFWRGLSFTRLLLRIAAQRLLMTVLADPQHRRAQPLHLRHQIDRVLEGWRVDVRAPRWCNDLERRLTRAWRKG